MLHVDEHYVVVNKPRGVPSIPPRDNFIENVLGQVQLVRGCSGWGAVLLVNSLNAQARDKSGSCGIRPS